MSNPITDAMYTGGAAIVTVLAFTLTDTNSTTKYHDIIPNVNIAETLEVEPKPLDKESKYKVAETRLHTLHSLEQNIMVSYSNIAKLDEKLNNED